ncbi:hypothetical protein, partial [Burkholderia pseudomallei]
EADIATNNGIHVFVSMVPSGDVGATRCNAPMVRFGDWGAVAISHQTINQRYIDGCHDRRRSKTAQERLHAKNTFFVAEFP